MTLFSDVSTKSVESLISTFFNGARDRHGGREKRRGKSVDQTASPGPRGRKSVDQTASHGLKKLLLTTPLTSSESE